MEDLNYEQDVSIDESALDAEWLEQPKLMMKYTRLEAEGKREVEQAKNHLDIVKADLYQEICNNPDKYDLPKTTESAIDGAIKMHDKYKEAKEALTQAEYELNMATAAVRSMYGKKEALENLVRLFGQQYFAGPQVPRDLSKEWQKKQKQKNSNKSVSIGKRKKKKSKKKKRRRKRKK